MSNRLKYISAEKIRKTIESCKTTDHLDISNKMIDLFNLIYSDGDLRWWLDSLLEYQKHVIQKIDPLPPMRPQPPFTG